MGSSPPKPGFVGVREYRHKRQNSDGNFPRLGPTEHHPLSLSQPYFWAPQREEGWWRRCPCWAEPAVFVSSRLISMGTGGGFPVNSFCPEHRGTCGGVVSELSSFMPGRSQDRVKPLSLDHCSLQFLRASNGRAHHPSCNSCSQACRALPQLCFLSCSQYTLPQICLASFFLSRSLNGG